MTYNKVHLLKIRDSFYKDYQNETLHALIWYNDCNFSVDDVLVLVGIDGGTINNEGICTVKVTNIITSDKYPCGLQPGYIIMSIEKIFNIELMKNYCDTHNLSWEDVESVIDDLKKLGLY